jgi:hypothetical protein
MKVAFGPRNFGTKLSDALFNSCTLGDLRIDQLIALVKKRLSAMLGD